MKFADGEVMDINANVFAERMYTQFNEDGNDLLLIDSSVDYIKTDWEI